MKARTLLCAAVAGVFLSGIFALAHAEEKKMPPDATLTVTAKALGAGAGYSWGDGKLTYKGKTYPIEVDGLTVGTVGANMIEATGEVYDLKQLSDFEGTYAAGVAGGTVGGGGGIITMKNQNGVQITMTAATRGVSLTLGASGVKFSLKK